MKKFKDIPPKRQEDIYSLISDIASLDDYAVNLRDLGEKELNKYIPAKDREGRYSDESDIERLGAVRYIRSNADNLIKVLGLIQDMDDLEALKNLVSIEAGIKEDIAASIAQKLEQNFKEKMANLQKMGLPADAK